MYACMHVCMYACMHVCMPHVVTLRYACMHVCVRLRTTRKARVVCIYSQCMYVISVSVCMYSQCMFPSHSTLPLMCPLPQDVVCMCFSRCCAAPCRQIWCTHACMHACVFTYLPTLMYVCILPHIMFASTHSHTSFLSTYMGLCKLKFLLPSLLQHTCACANSTYMCLCKLNIHVLVQTQHTCACANSSFFCLASSSFSSCSISLASLRCSPIIRFRVSKLTVLISSSSLSAQSCMHTCMCTCM
jgi:hypothetical protein